MIDIISVAEIYSQLVYKSLNGLAPDYLSSKWQCIYLQYLQYLQYSILFYSILFYFIRYSFLKYSEDDFVKVGSRGGKSER